MYLIHVCTIQGFYNIMYNFDPGETKLIFTAKYFTVKRLLSFFNYCLGKNGISKHDKIKPCQHSI